MILKYPVNYIAITQYYKKGIHNGIDLGWSSAHGGSEQPIYAPADGIVVSARGDYNQTDASGSSYGNYVKIKHNDSVSTLCAHMKYGSVTLKAGDMVTKGMQIGIMGETGRADGKHLHYEVFLNDAKVNPEDYTYVFPNQTVSTNPSATKGLLYYEPTPEPDPEPDPTPNPDPEPTPDPNIEELKKQIQELEDKVSLQAKEIEALKNELNESEKYTFTYSVEKTSLYEIKLYEGETLLIKN